MPDSCDDDTALRCARSQVLDMSDPSIMSWPRTRAPTPLTRNATRRDLVLRTEGGFTMGLVSGTIPGPKSRTEKWPQRSEPKSVTDYAFHFLSGFLWPNFGIFF